MRCEFVEEDCPSIGEASHCMKIFEVLEDISTFDGMDPLENESGTPLEHDGLEKDEFQDP